MLEFTEQLLGGEPRYPEELNIVQHDDSLSEDTGLYQIKNYTLNNRPVWQNMESGGKLTFKGMNNSKHLLTLHLLLMMIKDSVWIILHENSTRNGTENGSKVYGWDYSDENSVWPNTNTLMIVGNLFNLLNSNL